MRADAGPSESCGLDLAFLPGPGCPEQYPGSQPAGEAIAEVGALGLQTEWRALRARAETLVAVSQGPLGLVGGTDKGTGKRHPEGDAEGGAQEREGLPFISLPHTASQGLSHAIHPA